MPSSDPVQRFEDILENIVRIEKHTAGMDCTSILEDHKTYDAVERCLERGVARREYSLASKVLHWLLPWRIPVYDSFVRLSVGVPEAWADREAYNRVTYRVLTTARNISAVDPAWMGSIEPRSTLRAFDKCFWWFGGGNAATAAEVKDPWRVVDDLGLKRPNPMC